MCCLMPTRKALRGAGRTELVSLITTDYGGITRGRSVARRDYERAQAIWTRLGPLARYCWRAPIRDYRPRMKEVLKLQGHFPHATVREPQLPVDDAERAELARLARHAGLLGGVPLRAVGD